MAYRERINPKTGNKEYKYRYYFIADGKKKDSETAWFTSKELAEKEGKKLKDEKEKADRNKVLQRRDKKLITAFEEFIEYLKNQSDKNESNTDKKMHQTAKAIYSKHFPEVTKNTRIKDITLFTFRNWISEIDKKEDISGQYIRVCRAVIQKFNIWLSNNGYYINEYQEEEFEIGIKRTKIKNIKYKNKELKGERNIISILDIKSIGKYYIKKGLGEFYNFYYYTLYYTLFFSGMRVEELAALQWKFIDLREGVRTISIRNAISEKENIEHALDRVKREIYKTKTDTSIRNIPIFDFYYELLIDYKESYKYEFGLSDKELDNAFVFCNLSKHNPNDYMKRQRVIHELRRVCNSIDMNKTDLQMFRHSCATFLILPPPDGLGYTEEKVKDYFGHQDSAMLNRVYARLTTIQKADRMRHTFSEIYKPSDNAERTKEEKEKLKMIKRIKGDNKIAALARKDRIFKQIDKAINNKQDTYYYKPKDKNIIQEYIDTHEIKITFIEE